jgi:hypothetical protein
MIDVKFLHIGALKGGCSAPRRVEKGRAQVAAHRMRYPPKTVILNGRPTRWCTSTNLDPWKGRQHVSKNPSAPKTTSHRAKSRCGVVLYLEKAKWGMWFVNIYPSLRPLY